MTTSIAAVALCLLLSASSALAATQPTSETAHLQPNSTIYIVPSEASPKLSKFLKHSKLKIVASSEDAQYVVSCQVVSGDHHPEGAVHKTAALFAGSYYPMDVSIEVNTAKTGELIFSKVEDTLEGGAPEHRKQLYEAIFCAHQLKALSK